MSQIPPVGMKFRLVGVSLQNMIVGHRHQLEKAPVKKNFNYNNDSWFTLEESDKEGYYRIIHCTSGHKLVGGRKHENKAFLYLFEDLHDDQLWRFEFGDETQFQVINFCDEAKLFLRDHDSDIDIGVFPDERNYDDQFFRFYFEELEFVSLDFDLDEGAVLSETPEVIASRTFTNNTSLEQSDTFKCSYQKVVSHMFSYTEGFRISFSMEISMSAQLPLVADASTTLTLGTETEMTWTEERVTEKSKEFEFEHPVNVPPRKMVKASAVITKAKLDVPYTLKLRAKGSDHEVVSYGKWKGVANFNIRDKIEEFDL